MSTAPRVEHEIHSRRRSRNVGLGVVLLAFVFLIMGLTYVKLTAQNAAIAEAHAKKQAAAEASEGTVGTPSNSETPD